LKLDPKTGRLKLTHADLVQQIGDWLTLLRGYWVLDLEQNGVFVPWREVCRIANGTLKIAQCQRLEIGEKGRADMLVMRPARNRLPNPWMTVFFIEPKAGRDTVKPEQKEYADYMLAKYGIETCVPKSLEDLKVWMKERGV
jgi:hypothetical protein